VARADSSVVIVAEVRSGLVGYVELIGGPVRRNRPTAQLVIGVLAEASGQGVGSGLLREARAWAAQHGLHRVELTVMAHNHRARSLYERMGFVLEGRRAECLFVEGGSSTSCIWPCSCPVLPGAKATANLERITIE
jgi:RimJ/RimL family protein N-acetyltransferase